MIEAPTWTADQIGAINDRFWHGREIEKIPCPLCGAEMRIDVSGRSGFPKHMRASCGDCGAKAAFRSAAEKGADLAEERSREIVGLYLRRRSSSCPHDGTPLQVTRYPVQGGRGFYSVLCPRCGAYGEVHYSPEEPITTAGKD